MVNMSRSDDYETSEAGPSQSWNPLNMPNGQIVNDPLSTEIEVDDEEREILRDAEVGVNLAGKSI